MSLLSEVQSMSKTFFEEMVTVSCEKLEIKIKEEAEKGNDSCYMADNNFHKNVFTIRSGVKHERTEVIDEVKKYFKDEGFSVSAYTISWSNEDEMEMTND